MNLLYVFMCIMFDKYLMNKNQHGQFGMWQIS